MGYFFETHVVYAVLHVKDISKTLCLHCLPYPLHIFRYLSRKAVSHVLGQFLFIQDPLGSCI